MTTKTAAALASALLSMPGLSSAQTFTDVTRLSGIQAIRDTKPQDWWLSGLFFVDLDGDGDLDLYLSCHNSAGLAALNDGHGVFTLAPGAGTAYPTTETHMAYDINEDGLVDLSMTYGDGRGQWWRNASIPGILSFANETPRGGQARNQAMIDMNRDGKVDWVVSSDAGINFDYGNGTGTFKENSKTIATPGGEDIHAIPVDLDGDGDIDIVSHAGAYDRGGNYLSGTSIIWINDGNLNFTDSTTSAGLHSDNLAVKGVADFDQDGDIDILAIEDGALPPSLFLNDGTGHFTKKTGAITGASGSAHATFWGLAIMTDFDNDGNADIIFDARNFLHIYRGTGGGNFVYANASWHVDNIAACSVDDGYTFGDVDGDGDLDLLGYSNAGDSYSNRQLRMYRNDFPPQNWIKVRPIGAAGNKGAAGSKIRIYDAGTTRLLWFEQVTLYDQQSQQNYYAYDQTERHYGLGSKTSVDVEVEFYPSGKIIKRSGVDAKTTVVIREDASPVDNVRPTVTLTAPSQGSQLSGTVAMQATASDNVGIVIVRFLVDGASVGEDTSAPYEYDLDTNRLSAGQHTLSAKAWDASGNFGTAASVTVQVAAAGDHLAPAAPTRLSLP